MLCLERLRLEEGSIYGVIGPSGAGKSTLLRMINLLTPPDSGKISFNGKPVPANGAALFSL
ncbi:MAG: ATP-binding cassette domain-containing protein, partial [Bacillota bacterium]